MRQLEFDLLVPVLEQVGVESTIFIPHFLFGYLWVEQDLSKHSQVHDSGHILGCLHASKENHHFEWENQLFLWPFSMSQTVRLLSDYFTPTEDGKPPTGPIIIVVGGFFCGT